MVSLRVPFHDIDSLGIAWHGHYYKYFELARTELYRACALDIPEIRAMGYVLPVIESQCRYVQPLKYGQSVYIHAEFVEHSSYIKIVYTIRDEATGKRMAYGHTKQAVCEPDGTLLIAVPDEVVDAIRP